LVVSKDEKVCEETLGAPCLVFWHLDEMVRKYSGAHKGMLIHPEKIKFLKYDGPKMNHFRYWFEPDNWSGYF
jgi:hypothetical protein